MQAFTSAGSDATPPPNIIIQFTTNPDPGATYNLVLGINGTNYAINVAPVGTTTQIPSDAFSSQNDYATAIASYIIANFGSTISLADNDGNGRVTFSSNSTGVAAQLSIDITSTAGSALPNFSGGGNGTDAIGPSGQVTEVVLIAGVGGKKIKMSSGGFDGSISNGVNIGLYLRSPSDVDTQISALDTPDHCSSFVRTSGVLVQWNGGQDAGESLVAKLVNGTLPTDASTCLVEVTAEQY